jgi:hypothetical protein
MKPFVSLPLSLSLAAWVGLFSTANALPLPDNSTTATSSTAFQITNTGSGKAGQFDLNNAANSAPALTATSNGTGYGLFSLMTGTGRGGYFQINNAANTSYAIGGISNGKGYGVYGLMTGIGRAGHFEIANAGSGNSALSGTSNGSGYSLAGFMTGTGRAGFFQITNAANPKAAVEATTNGSGSAIKGVAGTGLAGEFTGNVTATGSLLSGGTVGSTSGALELKVGGNRLYRLENATNAPYGYSPNLIGGWSVNGVGPDMVGATIGGGGLAGHPNQVSGSFGIVSGGSGNTASGNYATVGGGASNLANNYSTVGGGDNNYATFYSTVSGGDYNNASGNYSAVGGGSQNNANGSFSTVSGGNNNTASNQYATVGGGETNNVSGNYSIVGGGQNNTINSDYSTVGGGLGNSANVNDYSTVGGGNGNVASGLFSTVGGGYQNTASASSTTVSGGANNTANSYISTVGGGANNIAAGNYSYAAGYHAQANHYGSFVWADASTATDIGSSANDEVTFRASGGVRLFTNDTLTSGLRLAPGGSQWLAVSDRNMKDRFKALDPKLVLDKFAQMPITEWSYKAQDPSIRHIGPMAQDFYQAFGLGEDKLRIGTMDADGVMMAAIQGLNAKLSDAEKENAEMKKTVRELQKKNTGLEARLARLERLLSRGKAQ